MTVQQINSLSRVTNPDSFHYQQPNHIKRFENRSHLHCSREFTVRLLNYDTLIWFDVCDCQNLTVLDAAEMIHRFCYPNHVLFLGDSISQHLYSKLTDYTEMPERRVRFYTQLINISSDSQLEQINSLFFKKNSNRSYQTTTFNEL